MSSFLLLSAIASVVVSGGDEIDYQPSPLQDPDGRLVVAFERLTPPSQGFIGDIWVTFSSDTGSTWTEPVPAVTGDANQRHPALVRVHSGGYRLFYLSDETGQYRIFSAFSADGVSWTEEGEVELGWPSSAGIGNPTVSPEGDSALVMSYDRFFGLGGYSSRSTDGGVSWDDQMIRINQRGRLNRIIRHSDGTYLCSWQETGGGTIVNIFASYSDDLVSWAPSESLTTNDNGHDPMPFEDAYGHPWVYYAKHSGSVYEIMRRRVEEWGVYQDEELVYSGSHNATQPHPLQLLDGRVALFWGEWWNGYDQSDVMMEILDTSGTGPQVRGPGPFTLELGPNPFSSALSIDIDLPHAAFLTVEAYDLSGRLAAVLFESPVPEGPCSLEWDPSPGTPCGVYTVRASWEGGSITSRCLLLR